MRCWPIPVPSSSSCTGHGPNAGRSWCVLAVDAEQFRAPVSISDDPWRLGARFEVWTRPPALPRVGQHLRRAGREGAGVVVGPQGSPSRRRRGGRRRTRRRDPSRRHRGLDRRRPAWAARRPATGRRRESPGASCTASRWSWAGSSANRLSVPVTAALAPDQLAAVQHGAGPARIIAPAGSGKTRVLTERLRHLVVDRGIERENVLAVAYNKKAQLEMEERTTDFRPRVSTLNALGYRLLAEHAGGSPRVFDERDVRRIVDDLVPRGRPRANTDRLAPYLEGLTAIRLGLRDPDEVEAERDDVPGLAVAFGPYRDALSAAGRGRLRRADLPRDRGAPRRRRVPAPGAARVPPPPRRRVPGPHACARAAAPAARESHASTCSASATTIR